MENLNEMSAKELKAMAKELGIKNWWTKNKAQLIEEIDDINIEELNEEVEEAASEPEETIEEIVGQDTLEEQERDEQSTETSKEKKSRGKQIEFNGKSMNLNEWAKELEMTRQTLYARLYIQHWDVEKAFTTPGRKAK